MDLGYPDGLWKSRWIVGIQMDRGYPDGLWIVEIQIKSKMDIVETMEIQVDIVEIEMDLVEIQIGS
jgi:hypothetical protein